MVKELLSEKIRNLADNAGIDTLGFTAASEFTRYAVKNSRRQDPKLSLPDAKTIIVAGIYIGGGNTSFLDKSYVWTYQQTLFIRILP